MLKDAQESMIEFRWEEDNFEYPTVRGLIVFLYGGTLEQCIEKARKEFNLGEEWRIVKFEDAES